MNQTSLPRRQDGVPDAGVSQDPIEEPVTLAELDASVGTGPDVSEDGWRCATTPTKRSWRRSGCAAAAEAPTSAPVNGAETDVAGAFLRDHESLSPAGPQQTSRRP